MDYFYTAMENTLAHFIYYFNENSLAFSHRPCAWELFEEAENTCFQIDEQKKSVGKSELWQMLENIQNRQKESGRQYFIFASSPIYSCENGLGRISCDTYVYTYEKGEKGSLGCRLRIMRLDLAFRIAEGKVRIWQCQWHTIQTMEPWPDESHEAQRQAASFDALPMDVPGTDDARDYMSLKKLVNRLWDRLLENTSELFVRVSEEKKLKAYFQTGDKNVPAIVISGPVAVNISENKTALAVSLAEVFKVRRLVKETDGNAGQCVERSFSYIRFEAHKNGGEWKISKTEADRIFMLPPAPYVPGIRYDKISQGLRPWTLHNENRPGEWIKDSYAIENIMSRWVYACRRGELEKFFYRYMSDDGFVPEMLIKSQGEGTPGLSGKDAITARLGGMDKHFVNRMYSYHTATTPLVEISSDGQSAKGTWFDHSATNLSGEAKSPTQIPYMIFVARYVHEFHKFHGQWYLTNFFWEPLIHLEPWQFDLNRSEGWVSREDTKNYPDAFAFLDQD